MSGSYLISDLHLFSRRTLASDYQAEIEKCVRRAQCLVLGGDIVDFRWSCWPTPEDTAREAKVWLQALLELNQECVVHYVLGNHDHHPEMESVLIALSQEHANFKWARYYLRIGTAIILHGDAASPRMNPARLERARDRFAAHGRPARWQDRAYDLAVAARLHVMVSRLCYPRRQVCRRLHRYLEQLPADARDGVEHVYFGHTHLALSEAPWKGRLYHNGGAPMPGLSFAILPVALT